VYLYVCNKERKKIIMANGASGGKSGGNGSGGRGFGGRGFSSRNLGDMGMKDVGTARQSGTKKRSLDVARSMAKKSENAGPVPERWQIVNYKPTSPK
jgi:hypothetical protein